MDVSASRVNGQYLPAYSGKRVCIIGKVLSQNGNVATIQSSDNHQIAINRNPGANYGSQFVEVVGMVNGQSIQEERACDFGDNFDLETYDALVHMMNGKFKNMFSD
mmetsp:Transcript_16629/g.21578  ORF Transcript_16629/g.21578 Transcript_16629/m.21578 type:complete len:106 (+) Transcript_16629:73-390(+)